MSTDLVKFLRERLADDERIARAATAGPWRHSPDKHWRKPGTGWFEEAVFAGPPGADATCVAGTGETDDPQSMADAAHIARHDPARVLAEVAAKRQIAEQHRPVGYGDVCLSYCHTRAPGQPQTWPCLTLRLLALPYAGHREYRPEWAPEGGSA